MKINHSWLAEYFEKKIPSATEIADLFNGHSYEVESIDEVGEEIILDVKILPNRAADSLSHRGVAKELSVISGLAFKDRVVESFVTETATLNIRIDSPSKCTRYVGRRISNIAIAESPEWLSKKLSSIGQRSINNVVDALNFVMFDIGQPLHAFDADKVKGQIVVRDAYEGESITALDGRVFNLESGDLLITDEEGILAIAGVKGGLKAEVTAETKNIILESANFTQAAVRRTSRRLQLLTDASKRYEGSLAPELAPLGMDQASSLILKIAGNSDTKMEEAVDIRTRIRNQYKLGVSKREINRLLGTSIETSEIEEIWGKLGFKYDLVVPKEKIVEDATKFLGVPYKYGASISYDAPHYFDCSSFIGFLFAEAGISIPRMTIDQFVFGKPIEEKDLIPGDVIYSQTSEESSESNFVQIQSDQTLIDTEKETSQKDVHHVTREFMPGTPVAAGVSHSGLYLGDGKIIHASGKWHKGAVVVENLQDSPAFKNVRGIRRFIFDNERYVVAVPFERQDLRIREDLIEEVGRVYGLNRIQPKLPHLDVKKVFNPVLFLKEKLKDIAAESGFDEVWNYSFSKNGNVRLLNPLSKKKPFMRSSLEEGILESLENNIKNSELLEGRMINIFEIGKIFKEDSEELHFSAASYSKVKPKNGALASLENLLSELKKIYPDIHADIKSKNDRYVFEFNVDSIRETVSGDEVYDFAIKEIKIQKTNLSNFPFLLRDVAVWVDKDSDKSDVEQIIRSESGEWLARLELFDEFRKDNRVSLAYHLVFQANDRTLTDGEVGSIMDRVYGRLKDKNFEIR